MNEWVERRIGETLADNLRSLMEGENDEGKDS
jgi:hypothetical protein